MQRFLIRQAAPCYRVNEALARSGGGLRQTVKQRCPASAPYGELFDPGFFHHGSSQVFREFDNLPEHGESFSRIVAPPPPNVGF